MKRIADFPDYPQATDSDLLLIWDTQNSLTKSIKKGNLLANFNNNIGWQVKSNNYTVANNDQILIDATQAWTLNLPSNFNVGNAIQICGYKGTNQITVNANNQKINGKILSQPYFQSLYQLTNLIYCGNDGWVDTLGLIKSTPGYSGLVNNGAPYIYLRFNESSGNAVDSSGNNQNGIYVSPPLYQQPGFLKNDSSNYAVKLAGNTSIYFSNSISNPLTFTLEAIFKTTAASGGIIGFTNSQTGQGGAFDRDLYVNNGKISFLCYGGANLTSPATYNDGNYHICTAVLYSGGAELWIDGVLVASSSSPVAANYVGYWHVGFSGYGGNFNGYLDEVSITNSRISQTDIKARHSAAMN
jgi:Concanavalin A-like lectin/glucanases superfamily